MSETKLLPCPNPWCVNGKVAARELIWPRDMHDVSCACGVNSPAESTEELAIAAWNTRTPDPRNAAAQGLADALEGAQTQLNYVGYGDAWEREGTEGLREQIDSALAAWEKAQ